MKLTEKQKLKIIQIIEKELNILRFFNSIFIGVGIIYCFLLKRIDVFLLPLIFIIIFINNIRKYKNRIKAINNGDYELILDTIVKKQRNRYYHYLKLENSGLKVECDGNLWRNLSKGDKVYYIEIENYQFVFDSFKGNNY